MIGMSRMMIMVMMAVAICGVTWDGSQGTLMLQFAEAQRKLYKPPLRNAKSSRLRSGVRGPGDPLPSVWGLAPDHLGFTVHEQPELYWYLSEASSYPMEVTVRDSVSIEPLFELRLKPPVSAGIHRTRLADHGIRLDPNVSYEWFVAILTDLENPSLEVVTRGTIQRIEPSDPRMQQVATEMQNASTPADQWHTYASAGMWYDALAMLSALIQAVTENTELRYQRAALLDEVGLAEAAAYDRKEP